MPVIANQIVLGTFGIFAPSLEDLMILMYQCLTGTEKSGATFTIVQVNSGWYDTSDSGPEANLNIQYAGGHSVSDPQHLLQCRRRAGDALIGWLCWKLDRGDNPQTIITTYGAYEETAPPDDATSVRNLFASGKSGIDGGGCIARDNSFGNVHVQFAPVFLASCMCNSSFSRTRL